LEAARDEISSSNLGRHHRSRGAAFAELGWVAGSLAGGLQLRWDHQQPWGDVGMVAAGGSWQPVAGWRVRLYHGQSFRAPSFTELYYVSPATVGNPELQPERGRTTEAGLESERWSLSLFRRSAHPLIDYVLGGDEIWRAGNVGGVTTDGVEAAFGLVGDGVVKWQRLAITYLDSSLDLDPERSRYALSHPRLEAAWTGALAVAGSWQAGWGVRWREPAAGGSWATVDLRLARAIGHGLSLAVDASNLFDRELTELHGVPLPGRWLSVTIRYLKEQP
jgi:iron complex outermembrane receptor protein